MASIKTYSISMQPSKVCAKDILRVREVSTVTKVKTVALTWMKIRALVSDLGLQRRKTRQML